MISAWWYVALFLGLLGVAGVAIWFNVWLEERWRLKDDQDRMNLWERQAENSEPAYKLEPRDSVDCGDM